MKYTKRSKKMSQQKFLALALMVSVAVMIPSLANALQLSSVVGTWDNVQGGVNINYPSGISNPEYDGRPENQVRWGTPVSGGIPDGQSGLGFTGVAPPPSDTFLVEEAFETGMLRHFNNPIYDPATAVDLTITMAFIDPTGLTTITDFTFAINETPNEPGPPDSDDIISFPEEYADETYDIGGTLYTLKLLGFGDSPSVLEDHFRSPEGDTNDTLLWAEITEDIPPIPEPTTIVLMGFGLLGVLGYVIRQRRKNQS
jgi:hypothetical protein